MGKPGSVPVAGFLLFAALTLHCACALKMEFSSEKKSVDFADGFQKMPDVVSFRPSIHYRDDSTKLGAHIVRFNFRNGTHGHPVVVKVKLGSSQEFINNGNSTITKHTTRNENIIETVKFRIAKGYTRMYDVGSMSATVSAERGVPLVTKADVSTSIPANYKYTQGCSPTNIITVNAETNVQIAVAVNVPGCHKCTFDLYVKQTKNFPIDYDSYSKVSGFAGSKRLSAAEVRAALPVGVRYVRDLDENFVEAISEGIMYAQYGLATFMGMSCDPIPNCPSGTTGKEPKTLHYEIPIEANIVGGSRSPSEVSGNEIGTSMGKDWNSLSQS